MIFFLSNKKKATPETAIKKEITQFLQYKNYFVFPILQSLGAYKGIPDLIACKNGATLFIEVKTVNGRQSEYQKHFQYCIEKAGCIYILARSSEDLEQKLAS